ncbi:HIT family protein [Streptomyces chrestomyceticus]|uniref:HIT family protein n=1 Tax=Streptomyces chrestomyceticus TaxID=68185 RepID=UPI0035A8D108
MTYDVFIDSFGARWQDPPPPRYRAAVLTINLTNQMLNPPDDPTLADPVARLTGLDPEMNTYVLATPGAARIVDDAVHELTALLTHTGGRPVQLLVNCWYGKHRAPAIADAIGRRLHLHGVRAAVTHHHIDKPTVPRKYPRPGCPFCAIIHDGAEATIVRAWPDTVAIVPHRGGCTPGHILVIPRGHVRDFTTDPVVSATTMQRTAELAHELDITPTDDGGSGCNTICNAGAAATQTIWHLHQHLIPRTIGDGLALPWTHPADSAPKKFVRVKRFLRRCGHAPGTLTPENLPSTDEGAPVTWAF